ncbi:MAG: DUF4391 domain-containing protein [Verrucomicrobiota bacterium]|jgi:hypothetical protein
MTGSDILEALQLPAASRVDQRVPKKLLVENGAPTAGDKRQIHDGVEELIWLAVLKPNTVGVPAYRDAVREYLEIAVLSMALRPDAKAHRLTELVHRAIPYPVLLIQSQDSVLTLSVAHVRWSQGQAGQTVLEGSVVMAELEPEAPNATAFLSSLQLPQQPRQSLHALYQGWMERFEAHAAAQVTGIFQPAMDPAAAERRRAALADHQRLTREIAALRASASRETQISRRVELNLDLKRLEGALAQAGSLL